MGVLAFWRFWGRVGLALRNVLTWFLWTPLLYVTLPLWLPLRWLWDGVKPVLPPIWRFLGRMGLAARALLTQLLWRPLRWLWLRLIRPFLATLWRWIWTRLQAAGSAIWQHTGPRRHLWRRRWRSRWTLWRARWRLRWRRPPRPTGVEVAPKALRPPAARVRSFRLATAVSAVAIVILVALLSWQERQQSASAVAADDSRISAPQIIVLTPTPQPATPSPIPTTVVQLTPWPTPDPTTSGGALLFSQNVDGNTDIYLLPVGQSAPVRLTTHPAIDREPVWSPDGTRIAFASKRSGYWDLFIYDIPSGALLQVTNDTHYDANPSWSPDGQWLAYESYHNENLDVFLAKVDGSLRPLRLTSDPGPDFAPAWEPRLGRTIAFTSWRSGNQDIYLRSLDDPLGDYLINVTETPDLDEDGAAFSPDGRYLAYAQRNDIVDLVYAVPLGEDATPATDAITVGQQGSAPSWSPDSQSLVAVYQHGERSYLVAGTVQAWGVAPQVYVGEGVISAPSWSGITLSPDQVAGLQNIDQLPDSAPLFVEAQAPAAAEDAPPVLLFEMPVNAPSPYLSDRVDQSFLALRERLLADAGWDVLGRLEGMFMALDERPLPGQTAESWNKAGRAFDLNYRDALGLEPQFELVREDVGAETYWRVYVRAAVQDGSMGEPLRDLPWDFRARSGDEPLYFDEGGKPREAIPSGYYIDLTALAADYGWQRAPSGSNWRTYFPDLRYWHFENRQGLSWEAAMLEIYTQAELTAVFGSP